MNTLVKYRFYVDFEKEERWVNDMVQQGWHLKKFRPFRYTFRKGQQGEYIYRNEMLENNKNDYLDFLQDSGVEVVCKFGGWAYFRKKALEGPFVLYTDSTSKINYYNRILSLFICLFMVNMIFVILNWTNHTGEAVLDITTLIIGMVNLIVAIIIAFQIVKISLKKSKMKKAKQLFDE